MKKGFFTSVAFHAIILIAVLIGLPTVKPFVIEPSEAITVDISTIADTTKLKAQTKSPAKPAPKPAPKAAEAPDKVKPPEKVEAVKKLAAAEPAKADPPPPTPEPKPEPEPPPPEPKKTEPPPPDQNALNNLLEADQQAIDDKRKEDEQKKKAEDKKKKVAEAKALAEQKKADDAKKLADQKKKRKLDMAQLDALLNKENTDAAQTLEKKSTSGDPETAEQDVQGESDTLQANINAQIGAMIENCWIPPPSSRDTGVSATLIWHVDRDGKLSDAPQVYGGEGSDEDGSQFNNPTNTYYDAVLRAATGGIYGCDFSRLPKKHYDKWKEMRFSFRPKTDG
jgi:hypothetical protein